jgi:rhodanese-related sulfurtransferase
MEGKASTTDDAFTPRRATAAALLAHHTAAFSTPADAPLIGGAELSELRRGEATHVVLIDVREAEEQALSQLPGAISKADFEELCTASQQWRETKDHVPIVLVPYCTIGYRSGLYARSLKARFPDSEVRNSEGVVMWTHDVGKLVRDGAPVSEVHVFGARWDYCAAGFTTATMGTTGFLRAAFGVVQARCAVQ